jgi:hypothetical protein
MNFRVYIKGHAVGIGIYGATKMSRGKDTIWFERDGMPVASFDVEVVDHVNSGLLLDQKVSLEELPAFID